MSAEIRVNDVGTSFRVTIVDQDGTAVNISSATTKQLLFKVANTGTVLTKAASFVTDGTDGKLEYVTESGDLSAAGKWSVQAYVILPGGQWHSDIAEFYVQKNIS